MEHAKAALFIAEGARLGRRKIVIHSDATRETVAQHLKAAFYDEAKKLGVYFFAVKNLAQGDNLTGEYIARLPRRDDPQNAEYGTSDRIKVRKAALWDHLL